MADSGQSRILIWNTFPDTNAVDADVVIGQMDFTSGGSGLSATKLMSPHGIVVVDDTLFVADLPNNRVMVWSPIPTTNGAAATFVLGQENFDVATDGAPSTQSISRPRQLSAVGGHLWVTDEGHERLLRFTLYPEAQ